MVNSKSSQTTRNVVIAFLALWSIISLIIIVVWATSPNVKSVSNCQEQLQTLTEKLEGAKAVWAKDKVALEEMVEEARDNQTKQQRDIAYFLSLLAHTNVSLDDCRQENANLEGNITALNSQLLIRIKKEANLTAEIMLQQELIDALQENLTQATHSREACMAMNSAADSQRLAAESQTKACESSKLYLQRQMQKCKTTNHDQDCEEKDNQSATLHTSIFTLVVICMSLHLFT